MLSYSEMLAACVGAEVYPWHKALVYLCSKSDSDWTGN